MKTSPRQITLLATILSLVMSACGGGEEPQIDPKDRCDAEGFKAYLDGQITNDDSTQNLTLSAKDKAQGSVELNEIRLHVGQATPPDGDAPQPVLLRLYDAAATRHLMHRLSDSVAIEPLTLQVVDASDIGPGSQGRTSLAGFDCAVDQGSICVQLGFDSDGDGTLHDDDKFAYNATAGTVTFLKIDNLSRRIHVELDISIGPNVLAFQDQSTGQLEGCLAPNYEQGRDLSWPLH